MTLRTAGGAAVALETGLHLFKFDTGTLTAIAHPEAGQEGVCLNEGKVDSRGRSSSARSIGSIPICRFIAR